MPALLETHQLCQHYGRVRALDDITLSLPPGGITGLVGKNGAGKTTLLALIAGALKPDGGLIRVLGQSPACTMLSGRIGSLLQEAHFKPGVAVSKQLVQFARLQGNSKQAAEQAVSRLLVQIGGANEAHKRPEAMSYGQRKRLGIAQAFLGSPALIILDEPTAGLDPVIADEIRQFIRHNAEAGSIIISSHNLYEIEDLCHRVLVLEAGRLITNTTIAELRQMNAVLHFTTAPALSEAIINEITSLGGVIGVRRDGQNPAKIACDYHESDNDQLPLSIQQCIIKHGVGILSMHQGNPITAEVLGL